jgi:hypothetical protein
MKIIALIAIALAGVFAATALAKPPVQQWFTHLNGHGVLVCDKGNNGINGPFASKEDCEAFIDGGGTTTTDGGGTTTTTAAAIVIPAPSANFLCYGVGDAIYVAPDYGTTLALLAGGYFDPTAYAGNVDGGTNVGAYHLSCTGAPGSSYIDDSGETSTENLAGLPGWYPIAA